MSEASKVNNLEEHSLNPTIAVREGQQLDVEVIDAVVKKHLKENVKEHIESVEGKPKLTQFKGGSSNLTYLLSYPNRDIVLRRPPFGTKAKNAHSMLREYTIMNKIKPAFSAVPETFFYTDDESILGSEFYLMEKVEGCSVSNQIPASWGFGATENHQLAMAMFDKLIELHQVDYTALDLADFGRPEGYVRRQIEGWTMRFEKALTDDVEAFTDVREWLLDRIPDKENKPAILHGDFRIDNMIVDADNPFHVKAVLDWEISALGDPLMDLANTLAYWVQADDSAALKAFAIQPSDADGMPTRAELLEYYGTKTGIDISQFDFYAVYGYFRNAVILQQIYYRYYHGQTSDKRFANFSAGVNALCQHCRVLIAASRL